MPDHRRPRDAALGSARRGGDPFDLQQRLTGALDERFETTRVSLDVCACVRSDRAAIEALRIAPSRTVGLVEDAARGARLADRGLERVAERVTEGRQRMSKGNGPRYRVLASAVPVVVAVLVGAADAPAAPAIDALKIIAPAAPGGGYDRTARAMQQALQEAGLARNVQVSNVPGAAGAIGLAQFIKNDRGRGNALIVGGFGMVASFLTNKSVVTLKDVTPIARLTGEFLLVVVPEASRFRRLADLTAALKADPGAVSIAGGSAGGSDHIAAALLAESVGVNGARVNYVAFSGGGDSIASLVGNRVSAGVGGYSELIGQVQAGKLRALGITAETRVPGIDIPTLREQGVDVALVNWRGVSAPPGLSPAQHQAYLALIDRMVKSEAWKAQLEKNRWSDQYLAGDRFVEYIAAEQARVEKVLRGLGLLK